MEIKDLIDKSNKQGNEVWISGSASEESILLLESKIGVELPQSYKNFLKAFGALFVMDRGLSGILKSDPLKMSGGGIYADTMFLRKDYEEQYEVPNYLWVIEKHECGAYCINTKLKTNGDELGIVNYEPHLPQKKHFEVLVESFPEFVEGWYFGFLENKEC